MESPDSEESLVPMQAGESFADACFAAALEHDEERSLRKPTEGQGKGRRRRYWRGNAWRRAAIFQRLGLFENGPPKPKPMLYKICVYHVPPTYHWIAIERVKTLNFWTNPYVVSWTLWTLAVEANGFGMGLRCCEGNLRQIWCCTGMSSSWGWWSKSLGTTEKWLWVYRRHHQISSSMISDWGSMYLMIFYDFSLLAPSYFDIVLDIYTQIIGIESAWKFAKTMLPSQRVSPSLKVDESLYVPYPKPWHQPLKTTDEVSRFMPSKIHMFFFS